MMIVWLSGHPLVQDSLTYHASDGEKQEVLCHLEHKHASEAFELLCWLLHQWEHDAAT